MRCHPPPFSISIGDPTKWNSMRATNVSEPFPIGVRHSRLKRSITAPCPGCLWSNSNRTIETRSVARTSWPSSAVSTSAEKCRRIRRLGYLTKTLHPSAVQIPRAVDPNSVDRTLTRPIAPGRTLYRSVRLASPGFESVWTIGPADPERSPTRYRRHRFECGCLVFRV